MKKKTLCLCLQLHNKSPVDFLSLYFTFIGLMMMMMMLTLCPGCPGSPGTPDSPGRPALPWIRRIRNKISDETKHCCGVLKSKLCYTHASAAVPFRSWISFGSLQAVLTLNTTTNTRSLSQRPHNCLDFNKLPVSHIVAPHYLSTFKHFHLTQTAGVHSKLSVFLH